MIFSLLTALAIGTVALLLLSAATAPLESLGWWAGWFGEPDTPPVPSPRPALAPRVRESPHPHFLVYLSGVGAIDYRAIPKEELDWIAALSQRIPQTEVVVDVFPYSVTNTGLSVQRFFARLWTYLEKRRLRNPDDLLAFLVNARNMLQVAVSADRRYGPIYNLGVANEIVKALQAQGYRLGSRKPVTLVGYSGGAQVALGVATFLKPILRAPLHVVSIGGVMSDDIGVRSIDRLYHMWGHRDPYRNLGSMLFPGRWRWFAGSTWNRAKRAKKIISIDMGDMHHRGATNYFSWTATTAAGKPHALATIDRIAMILAKERLIDPAALEAAPSAAVPATP